MGIKLIIPPEMEPLTLEEIKPQLRVDGNELDSEILSHIKSAREYAEMLQNRAILTQTWEISFDNYPIMPVILPKPPLQSVDFIKTIDESGVESFISVGNYAVDIYSEPGRILFKPGKCWPLNKLFPVNGVIIRFKCGYSGTELIPENIKSAMILHIKLLLEEYGADEKILMEKTRDNLLSIGRLWPV